MVELGRIDAGFVAFRPDPLARPIGTSGRRINWRYVSAVGSYHLLALLALHPWFFSWSGVALAVIGVYVFGAAGINLCYHRLLSHRSFSCYRNYATNDNSRNNMLVAIITSGEGWHNNHHAEPNSASNQRRRWEIDLTFQLLRLLVLLGLAWDVQLPKQAPIRVAE